jgi:hypothetical protein
MQCTLEEQYRASPPAEAFSPRLCVLSAAGVPRRSLEAKAGAKSLWSNPSRGLAQRRRDVKGNPSQTKPQK